MSECNKCGRPPTAGRKARNNDKPLCIGCAALDTVVIPSQPERLKPAPAALLQSPAWSAAQPFENQGRLWSHQAEALQALTQGSNTVLATATASGKSLVFQLWTLHRLAADPAATALVFYPTKALSNDQERRWRDACRLAGLPPETVATVNGDVAQDFREARLRDSRIIMTTPDVTHAWTTRMAAKPDVARFLRHLKTIIIDEAHTYEDVFGSNAVYLFRRLAAAAANAGNPERPGIVAATATILDPAGHMQRLTGQPFAVIPEEANGAPRHERLLAHLPLNFRRGNPEQNLAATVRTILEQDPQAQVIAFHDNRQGIERVAEQVKRPDTVSYRSGYRPEDRRRIEDDIREGKVRAVITTPALELGIDMPDLNYGCNLNLPFSKKQIRQRTGRVGRSRPGTFIILAPPSAFAEHGDTLAGYYRAAVEPSNLYSSNEYIAYQHALCLRAELEAAGQDTLSPPQASDWPPQFDRALKNAHGRPPRNMSAIHRRVAQQPPHLVCGMRDTGEESLKISEPEHGQFETIDIVHALREAYPGAIYRHRGKTFRIVKWARKRDTLEPYIEARPAPPQEKTTKPMGRVMATTALDPDHIIGARLRRRNRGELAHLNITVTESVEGYQEINGSLREYRKLEPVNPHLTRKQRHMPTTGVLLTIREPWFTGDAGAGWMARTRLAQALRRHLSYRRSIAAANIGIIADKIFIKTDRGFSMSDSSILIYDQVHGGLGLTEDFWEHPGEYAQAIHSGAQWTESRQMRLKGRPEQKHTLALCRWLEAVNDEPAAPSPAPDRTNAWRILRPGSNALTHAPQAGGQIQVNITEPIWQDGVHYRAQTPEGSLITVAEHALEAAPGQTDWALWEPDNGWVGEIPADLVYATERES